MRVLILGGTAFSGPHAVRELVAVGNEVTVFHRGDTESDLPVEVRHVYGDVAQFAERVDELRALEPDVVVDMLAYLPEEGRRVLAFKGAARHGVVVSSCDVYLAYGRLRGSEPGPPEPLPLTEDAPLRTIVVDDGYDKVGVEAAATSDPEFPVTVVRYPAVYGPGDSQHRLCAYLRRMDDRRPAILLDERQAGWRWARGYVEDVAHALALAVADAPAVGRVYNVAAPRAHTGEEWLRVIGEAVGWEGRIVIASAERLPDSLRFPGAVRQDYVLDTARIRTELGYAEVVDERTAVERTIAWERENPPPELELDYGTEDAVLASLA
jgi:nucleoside-diphosphate-sugar epimerase